MGFTAVKFDPAGPYSTFDPRQPSLERCELCEAFCRQDPRGRGDEAAICCSARTASSRPPARSGSRDGSSLTIPVVRGADAAGDAGGDGAGRARDADPDRDRRAADDQI